jgi:Low-density lipoprotein receptor repeat class B
MRNSKLALIVIAAACAFAVAGTAQAAAVKVYWTDSNNGDSTFSVGIWRANTDGSEREPLTTSRYGPWAIDTDSRGRKIYWARNDVLRSNLDGSGVQLVTSAPLNAIGVAVDESAGKVYWVDSGAPSFGIPGTLGRANLDGSSVEIILSGFGAGIANPREVAVDPVERKVYWTETGFGVRRVNMDGTGMQTIASGNGFASAIAVDALGRKVYWSDNGTIFRANLDGSSRQPLLSASALGVAVDPDAGKLYFTNLFPKSVGRANLDGSGLEVLATGQLDTPWSIALLTLAPDTTPPDTRILAGPEDGSIGNQTDAVVSFTGDDDVTPPAGLAFQCALDGEPFSSCESPRTISGLAEGDHTFEVRAIDEAGNVDATPARIHWIVDLTPPTLAISATPDQLSPPNHRLEAVAIGQEAFDANGVVAVWLADVTSSESDEGLGDGDQPDDIQDADLGSLDEEILLRAERSGNGPGRAYTITLTAMDSAGNIATVSTTVAVPHDNGD